MQPFVYMYICKAIGGWMRRYAFLFFHKLKIMQVINTISFKKMGAAYEENAQLGSYILFNVLLCVQRYRNYMKN